MAFQLPDLPYPFDALEPHIDAQTMEIHHDKHHAAYTTNLNNAIAGTEFENMDLYALLAKLESVPEEKRMAVRNNGGGYANHNLFWEIMGPNAGGAPTGELAKAIDEAFGNLDGLKEKFSAAGATRFGSGWAWLGVGEDGKLCVCSTPNQDNPWMTGVVGCTAGAILALDVWEHAYYLKYQNRRPDYIKAWWNVVNWDAVAQKYAAAKK